MAIVDPPMVNKFMLVPENNVLHQPTTFRPFPREFATLVPIALRTSKHKITDIIGRNASTSHAAYRIGMFDMEDVFSIHLGEFGKAASSIIAAILLTLQLIKYLLLSMSSWDRFLVCIAIAVICIALFSIDSSIFVPIFLEILLMGESILFLPESNLNKVTLMVFFCCSSDFFFVSQLVLSLEFSHFLIVSFIPLMLSSFFLFLMFVTITVTTRITTYFTYIAQSRFKMLISIKELSRGGMNILAFRTLFHALWNRFFEYLLRLTSLALVAQTIMTCLINKEILTSSREEVQASEALLQRDILGYSITHGTSPSSHVSSRLRMFTASRGYHHVLKAGHL